MGKEEQVSTIINRGTTMLLDQCLAERSTIGSRIGSQQNRRFPRSGSLPNNFSARLLRKRGGQQDPITRCRPRIQHKTAITAMLGKVLKLHSPFFRYPCRHQSLVERPFIALEISFHKDLTHDLIDKGRVYPVTSKIARTRHPRRECRQPKKTAFEGASIEFHRLLLFQQTRQTPRRKGDL